MTDYMSETAGNYYTQRWYIARRDQGSETLCDYYPPTDDNSIIYGGEWTRFSTSDPISLQAQLNKSKSWVIPSVALDGHVAE